MNLHDEIMNIQCDNPIDWGLCGKGQGHAYRAGHKHARHAAAELALDAVAKWQPIATAPKDGTVVDLWIKGELWENGGRKTSLFWDGEYWTDEYEEVSFSDDFPLYWMPIPPPPEK